MPIDSAVPILKRRSGLLISQISVQSGSLIINQWREKLTDLFCNSLKLFLMRSSSQRLLRTSIATKRASPTNLTKGHIRLTHIWGLIFLRLLFDFDVKKVEHVVRAELRSLGAVPHDELFTKRRLENVGTRGIAGPSTCYFDGLSPSGSVSRFLAWFVGVVF